MYWQILHQLKSKDASVRLKAVEQLHRKPNERALKILGATLQDPDVEVRRLTVRALARLETDTRFEFFLGALRDRDNAVVQAAAAALKGGPPDRVIPALEPLLRHRDAGVRGQAAQTLETLGWRPGTREEEIWNLVARAQFFQAAGFGVAAVPALESALATGATSIAAGVIEALGHVGDPCVLRPLLQALKSTDPGVCLAAVTTLTRLEAPEAAGPILNLLKHRNAQVRVAVVEALGRLRVPGAAQPVSALLKDSAWEVRREAAETLGRLGDRSTVEALSAGLSDSDADVREAVAIALGALGDPKAIGPLVLALRDPTSGVRRIAAATLSRLDTDWSRLPEARAAAEELKTALHDHDPGVRHFVGHLLAAMNVAESAPASAASPGEADPAQRRKLALACFLRVLKDADRDLRLAAVRALKELSGDSAHAGLMRARHDNDPAVRAAIEDALGPAVS